MKSSTKTLVIILAVIAILVVWFIGAQNNLVSLEEEVRLQYAQVESQLQRRSDLIPNLVETVKGYASHEEEVFTQIADARAKLAGSIETGDIESIDEANNELNSALSRLLVITENYPELKANEQFVALQDELAGTENRITVARQDYNETVGKYNKAIKMFPTSVVANMAGYEAAEYFEADEDAKDAPVVSFD
ncbi:MAG: LemA family protein [Clostridia bacterium]|nr:LemA family protein [Clostridia bacterium]